MSELTKETIKEKLGGYNSMPPNWEPITESEYLWRYGQKHATGWYEFRQVVMPSVAYGETKEDFASSGPSRELFCHVYMWVNHDFAGVGMIVHYNGKATRSGIDAFFPQYFKFKVCEHEYETTVQRMCYWEGVCKKCGYHHAVDSSG